MRQPLAIDATTGTTRHQEDDEVNDDLSPTISYRESLGCVRHDYERKDVKKSKAPKPVEAPMAQVSWSDSRSTAEVLRDASDLALRLEMRRRGYIEADEILSSEI